jgi:hypothetical protein
MKVALYDIKNYQAFIDILAPDVIPIRIEGSDTFASIKTKILDLSETVTHIVIAQHSSPELRIGAEAPISYTYSSSWDPLKKFLIDMRAEGLEYVDFLACMLYSQPGVVEMFRSIEADTGVDLRASTNMTGNSDQSTEVWADWIMESDLVDISTLYFNASISNYKELFNYDSSYSFSVFRSRNYIIDSSGNPVWFTKDICGNPMNSRYDLSGRSIKFSPGYVVSTYRYGNIVYGNEPPSSITASTSQVVAIHSTTDAFAALKADGTVDVWGADSYGGNNNPGISGGSDANYNAWTSKPTGMRNIISICSNNNAFAALDISGKVYAWGSKLSGGSTTSYISANETAGRMYYGIPTDLSNVVQIYACQFYDDYRGGGFLALTKSNTVYAWGTYWLCTRTTSGFNNVNYYPYPIANVKSVIPMSYSFYGFDKSGIYIFLSGIDGTSTQFRSNIPTDISGVANSVSYAIDSYRAYAALKKNKTVIVWGNASYGGGDSGTNTSSIIYKPIELSSVTTSNIAQIFSNDSAFVALDINGKVYAWGDANNGGKITDPNGYLSSNVYTIYNSYNRFVALKKDSSCYIWGSGLSSVTQLFDSTYNICSVVASYNYISFMSKTTVYTYSNTNILSILYTSTNIYDAPNTLYSIFQRYNWYDGLLTLTNQQKCNILRDYYHMPTLVTNISGGIMTICTDAHIGIAALVKSPNTYYIDSYYSSTGGFSSITPTIYLAPTISSTTQVANISYGNRITLLSTVTGGKPGYIYKWSDASDPNIILSDISSYTINYKSPMQQYATDTIKYYTLTVTDSIGGTSTLTYEVNFSGVKSGFYNGEAYFDEKIAVLKSYVSTSDSTCAKIVNGKVLIYGGYAFSIILNSTNPYFNGDKNIDTHNSFFLRSTVNTYTEYYKSNIITSSTSATDGIIGHATNVYASNNCFFITTSDNYAYIYYAISTSDFGTSNRYGPFVNGIKQVISAQDVFCVIDNAGYIYTISLMLASFIIKGSSTTSSLVKLKLDTKTGPDISNAVQAYSNDECFAIKLSNNKVVVYGNTNYGGNFPTNGSRLAYTARTVRFNNDSCISGAWTHKNWLDLSSGNDLIIKDNIYSTSSAFAAIDNSGRCYVWGRTGGIYTNFVAGTGAGAATLGTDQGDTILSSPFGRTEGYDIAYPVLCEPAFASGSTYTILSDIINIYPSYNFFIIRRSNGYLYSWGSTSSTVSGGSRSPGASRSQFNLLSIRSATDSTIQLGITNGIYSKNNTSASSTVGNLYGGISWIYNSKIYAFGASSGDIRVNTLSSINTNTRISSDKRVLFSRTINGITNQLYYAVREFIPTRPITEIYKLITAFIVRDTSGYLYTWEDTSDNTATALLPIKDSAGAITTWFSPQIYPGMHTSKTSTLLLRVSDPANQYYNKYHTISSLLDVSDITSPISTNNITKLQSTTAKLISQSTTSTNNYTNTTTLVNTAVSSTDKIYSTQRAFTIFKDISANTSYALYPYNKVSNGTDLTNYYLRWLFYRNNNDTTIYISNTYNIKPVVVDISYSSQTIPLNQSITLTVTASLGLSPYTYTWYEVSGADLTLSNSTIFSGVSTSILQITNAYAYSTQTNKTYRCKVTDSNTPTAYTAYTTLVTVTYIATPPITITSYDPSGQYQLDVTATKTLKATVAGKPNYTYRWYNQTDSNKLLLTTSNTSDISSSYTITNNYVYVSSDQIVTYKLDISGGDNTTTSQLYEILYKAYVTVTASTITPSVSVNLGGIATLSVTSVTGGKPGGYTYKWYEISDTDILITNDISSLQLTNNYLYVGTGSLVKSYKCVVSDISQNASTVNFTASYQTYPTVSATTTNPSPVIVNLASTATLSVTSVTGGKPPYTYTYKWYEVSGTTDIVIINDISSLQLSNDYLYAGADVFKTYKCLVSDISLNTDTVSFTAKYIAYQSITASATITQITVNPPNVATTLTVDQVAGGRGSYTYKWYKTTSGTEIFDSTSTTNSIILPALFGLNSAGTTQTYKCVVSDERNTNIVPIIFTIIYGTTLPITITQITDKTINVGEIDSVTVSATGGKPGGYTYEWYTVDSQSIPTAYPNTSALLNLSNDYLYYPSDVTIKYRCVVSDSISMPNTNTSLVEFRVTYKAYSSITATQNLSTTTLDIGQSTPLKINTITGGYKQQYIYRWYTKNTSNGYDPYPSSQNQVDISSITLLNTGQYTATPTIINYRLVITDTKSSNIVNLDYAITYITPLTTTIISSQGSTLGLSQQSVITVTASGAQFPYTYEWYSGSTKLIGNESGISINNNVLTITNLNNYINDTTIRYSCTVKSTASTTPSIAQQTTSPYIDIKYIGRGILTPVPKQVSYTIEYDNAFLRLDISQVNGVATPFTYNWYELSGQTLVNLYNNTLHLDISNNYLYYPSNVPRTYRFIVTDAIDQSGSVDIPVLYKAYPPVSATQNYTEYALDTNRSVPLSVTNISGGKYKLYEYEWFKSPTYEDEAALDFNNPTYTGITFTNMPEYGQDISSITINYFAPFNDKYKLIVYKCIARDTSLTNEVPLYFKIMYSPYFKVMPCFLEGTYIKTKTGNKLVQDLSLSDVLIAKNNIEVNISQIIVNRVKINEFNPIYNVSGVPIYRSAIIGHRGLQYEYVNTGKYPLNNAYTGNTVRLFHIDINKYLNNNIIITNNVEAMTYGDVIDPVTTVSHLYDDKLIGSLVLNYAYSDTLA